MDMLERALKQDSTNKIFQYEKPELQKALENEINLVIKPYAKNRLAKFTRDRKMKGKFDFKILLEYYES